MHNVRIQKTKQLFTMSKYVAPKGIENLSATEFAAEKALRAEAYQAAFLADQAARERSNAAIRELRAAERALQRAAQAYAQLNAFDLAAAVGRAGHA